MRVLLVPSVFIPTVGGVQLNTLELAKHLTARGHVVSVLTSNWQQWNLPMLEGLGAVRVIRLPFYVYRGSLRSLVAFAMAFPVSFLGTVLTMLILRPDIVNVHFLGANAFYVLLASRIRRTPLVASFHGNEVGTVCKSDEEAQTGYSPTEAQWMTWTIRRVLARATHITAVSSWLVETAIGLEPSVRHKSEVVIMPGAVGLAAVAPDRLGERRPFILAVGRLSHEKGFDTLLHALALLADCSARLTLVGDGPQRDELKVLTSTLGLQARVLMTGALAPREVAAYYQTCAFVVVPSRNEGQGNVVWEAFSHGKCVVGTAVGGIPELISDGSTGLLVPRDDPQELAVAMGTLLSNADLSVLLGRKARQFADTRADWDRVTDKFADIYLEALERPATPQEPAL